MDFRDEHHELWQKMHNLNIRFYQQPAGFEDSIISCYKVKEQGTQYPCSIGCRDMFSGGLSQETRNQMHLFQQIGHWMRGKVTPCIQITDTHVVRIMKLVRLSVDKELRVQLTKLANNENTRVVFKCCMFEIMWSLCETVLRTKSRLA